MIQLTQQEAEYILEQLNHVALQHLRAYNAVEDQLMDAIHNLDVKVNPEDFELGSPPDEETPAAQEPVVEETPAEEPTTDAEPSAE